MTKDYKRSYLLTCGYGVNQVMFKYPDAQKDF